ncbi:hypothetical protein B0T10DRAFT_483226 [Thelonectria olida]|uniref:Uncharacterized protein n=1 Tax=Thelonectria olida TaxID=1576542 RepID=A0A9P8W9S5_9HYPO|nr:hypothetical protein B0T10DRAFT_483226 [Thelonectria olida]
MLLSRPPWTVFARHASRAAGAAAYKSYATMTTPFNIHVEAKDAGLMGLKLGTEEAAKVTELLQTDLEKHHVFFNAAGYHDHLTHHLLTLYGTGASARDLQKAFDANKSYQLKAMKPRQDLVQEMEKDWDSAKDSVGKGRQYATFLNFFQNEIGRIGYKQVLLEYLFKDDERGRDLQSRLFGGLLHPLIQLSYGLEWEQPAIIASAMAQISVHSNGLYQYLTQCQSASASRPPDAAPVGSVCDFYTDITKNDKLMASARAEDTENPYYGILCNALDDMVELASRVRVKPDELDEKTAEMLHVSAYVCAAAAFHPPHVPKFDFFMIHQLTAAPFFLTLNKQSWIPTPTKVHLLESKIRMDMLQYLARGCPRLRPESLFAYTPADASQLVSKPEDLLPRIHAIVDDGHTVKVARAMMLAQRVSQPYKDRPWILVKDDDAWLSMLYLLVDANECWDVKWVRGAGFEQAWQGIPKQENHRL